MINFKGVATGIFISDQLECAALIWNILHVGEVLTNSTVVSTRTNNQPKEVVISGIII